MNLDELYQEMILDHGRRPRNKGTLENPTHHAHGYNPMCGDQVRLQLRVVDNAVHECKFDGCGCAISAASASLLTESIKGRPVEEVEALFRKFQDNLLGRDDLDLGALDCLKGVRAYPDRIKCAMLAWHALREALEGRPETAGLSVKTE